MKKILFLILALTAFNQYSFAQENISASLDKQKAYVGDIIEYRIKVELPKDAYISAKQNVSFNDFDVSGMDIKHLSLEPNVYEIIFKVAAFKTGGLALEPTAIFYLNPDGTNNLFFTPYTKVEIASLLSNGDKADIRDLKPLKKIHIKMGYVILICIIVLVIGFLIFIVYKDISELKKEEVPIDPQVAALDALKELYKPQLKDEEVRLFYYTMSEILRGYISYKYKFNAMEMTTAEFFEEIKKVVPPDININEIKRYLREFDLARYAAFSPAKEENDENYNFTKLLLEKL
ncbi:MAG: hypothetical protein LBV66_02310 [Elusimicrobiota bacterium]|jgi:hypothetical protein|nr:hypothetical protein [Elusimicrobiota bacterium]